eukprot:1161493-Pelagomonas_calceolata.AAC.7
MKLFLIPALFLHPFVVFQGLMQKYARSVHHQPKHKLVKVGSVRHASSRSDVCTQVRSMRHASSGSDVCACMALLGNPHWATLGIKCGAAQKVCFNCSCSCTHRSQEILQKAASAKCRRSLQGIVLYNHLRALDTIYGGIASESLQSSIWTSAKAVLGGSSFNLLMPLLIEEMHIVVAQEVHHN